MNELATTEDLREVVRQSIDGARAHYGARKLCRALALADGFSFQIAVCQSARDAVGLLLWLADTVAVEREEPVSTERISPYALDWRIPGPASVSADDLTKLVLGRLVGSQPHADLVFIDAAAAREQDADAWRWLFERLNERRNLISRDLRVPLTLILPRELEVEFARAAPDFWSIRRVAVRVGEFDDSDAEPEIWQSKSEPRRITRFSSDADLLTFARAGKGNAMRLLYQRYAPTIDRFVGRLVGEDEREDIRQKVFLHVLDSNVELRHTTVKAYLLGLAYKLARAEQQRKYRRKRLDTEFSTMKDAEWAFTQERFEQALDELPEELRSVMLFNQAGFSHDEIASLLDIKMSTVRRRKAKAVERLRHTLGPVGPQR